MLTLPLSPIWLGSIWPLPFFPAAPLLLWLLASAFGLVGAARRPQGPAKGWTRAAYGCGVLGGVCGLAGALGALGAPAMSWSLSPAVTRAADATQAAALGGLGGFGTAARADGLAGSPALAAQAAGILALRIDPLAAFFSALLCGVAAAVSVYALAYQPGHHRGASTEEPSPAGQGTGRAGRVARARGAAAPGPTGVDATAAPRPAPADHGSRRVPTEGHLAAGYHLFLGAILLVFLANSVLAFLVAWEAMSLLSYFLVLYDHEDADVRRAGFVYLVMTHAGTAFLLGAFLLLAGRAGGFTFESLAAAAQAGGPTAWKTTVFLLALVGFGTKAGLLPLHVWLPRAHPAAPTHVSALMSGVMVKAGIYGIVRFGWGLLGGALPAWVGVLLLAVGLASAVLGVLQALMEHDLKRLLAYHTVENIGIIAIGLGAAALLGSSGAATAAAIALGAALFHTANHGVFKSLLFLGAGAILQGAHTRDLEEMGGLIRRMPWTAAAFLVGSMAISGLPPLNGFASEWLTLQSLLALATAVPAAGAVASASLVWYAVGAVGASALLGLTAALAVACFVKAFGAAFLALPRHEHAASAAEVPTSMRVGMAALAAACVLLGLAAGGAFAVIGGVAATLVPGAGALPQVASLASIAVPRWQPGAVAGLAAVPVAVPSTVSATFSPLLLVVGLVAAGALALALRRSVGREVRVRRAPTWGCGIPLAPHMEYTPAAFAQPIREMFAWAVQPFRHTEVDYAPDAPPYFVRTLRYHAGVRPPIEHALYRRFLALLVGGAHAVRRVQTGSLRLYLAYMLVALALLLLWGR